MGLASEFRPPQFVATGGWVPSAVTLATSSSTSTRHDRTRHRIGAGGFRDLQVVWGNYYLNIGSEVDIPAVDDVQASILMNGVLKRLTFSGSNNASMTAGQALLISDKVTPEDFGLTAATSAGQNFYITARFQVTAPAAHRDFNPIGVRTDPVGEPVGSIRGMLTADTVNQVMTGVALTGGNVRLVPPLAIIGHTQTPSISLLATGDSLMIGQNDTGWAASDGSNGGGWLARACYSSQVPYCNVGKSGTSSGSFTGANIAKRALLFPYASHVINNFGANDLGAGGTATALVNNLRTNIWQYFSAMPNIQRVEQVLVIPRTTSTNSWINAAGQTELANYVTHRNAANAAIIANVGSDGLDAVIDFNTAAVEDPLNLGKWATNGTTLWATNDGIHRQAPSSIDNASVFETRLATWARV